MSTVGCCVSVQVGGLSTQDTATRLSPTAFLLGSLCGLRGRKLLAEFPKGTSQVFQKIN